MGLAGPVPVLSGSKFGPPHADAVEQMEPIIRPLEAAAGKDTTDETHVGMRTPAAKSWARKEGTQRATAVRKPADSRAPGKRRRAERTKTVAWAGRRNA
jgi:hypothetical protein